MIEGSAGLQAILTKPPPSVEKVLQALIESGVIKPQKKTKGWYTSIGRMSL